jgi:hypothetical protein
MAKFPNESSALEGFEAEPWEEIETKLVRNSVLLGLVLLVILGILINRFLLH